MGYKVSFLDNQEVTAQDLNDIRAGIPPAEGIVYQTFQNGITYGVDDLNEITQSLIYPGVMKGYKLGCSVSVRGTGQLFISAGKAFFGSGATIDIDTDGIELTYTPGMALTVYLFYSAAGNVSGAKIAETVTEEDYVILATISANGTLADARQYAYMKNASLLPNQYQTINQSVPVHTSGTQTIALPTGFQKFVLMRKIDATTYGGIVFLDCVGNSFYSWSGTAGVTYKTAASDPTSIVRGTNVTYDAEHHSLVFVPTVNEFDFDIEIHCM